MESCGCVGEGVRVVSVVGFLSGCWVLDMTSCSGWVMVGVLPVIWFSWP